MAESLSNQIQGSPCLLRVKKEEELQELPLQVNCGETIRSVTDAEINKSAPAIGSAEEQQASIGCPPLHFHRHTSPPPEDWKPLDKCCLCLDGKLFHEDQPPLVSNRLLTFKLILLKYRISAFTVYSQLIVCYRVLKAKAAVVRDLQSHPCLCKSTRWQPPWLQPRSAEHIRPYCHSGVYHREKHLLWLYNLFKKPASCPINHLISQQNRKVLRFVILKLFCLYYKIFFKRFLNFTVKFFTLR